MISQTWLRERGSRPVVGSSRNISCGVTTMLAAMSRRRRIPPENFLTSRLAASESPNASSNSSARSLATWRLRPSNRPDQDQVFPAGEVLVHRRELTGEADRAANGVGLLDDVVPEDASAAGIWADQRREHTDRGRLAGAVGAEHAVDGPAAHGEIHPVNSPGVTEGLDESGCLDREM